jgi:7-carboxy-7-deazaguanine synthase
LGKALPKKGDGLIMREYRVTEIFYSVQGEGPHVGTPAFFIRFAGCNLYCPFCDTDHKEKFIFTASQIMNQLASLANSLKVTLNGTMIVLTGGEPMLQVADGELVEQLTKQFSQSIIEIETNGTIPQGEYLAKIWGMHDSSLSIICSPKKGSKIKLQDMSAVKLVVSKEDTNDMVSDRIRNIVGKKIWGAGISVYLQPMWAVGDTTGQAIENTLQILRKHSDWKLSIQTHKYLGIQ